MLSHVQIFQFCQKYDRKTRGVTQKSCATFFRVATGSWLKFKCWFKNLWVTQKNLQPQDENLQPFTFPSGEMVDGYEDVGFDRASVCLSSKLTLVNTTGSTIDGKIDSTPLFCDTGCPKTGGNSGCSDLTDSTGCPDTGDDWYLDPINNLIDSLDDLSSIDSSISLQKRSPILSNVAFNLDEYTTSSDLSQFSLGILVSSESTTSNEEPDVKVQPNEELDPVEIIQLSESPTMATKIVLHFELTGDDIQFPLFKISERKARILVNSLISTTLLDQVSPSTKACTLYKLPVKEKEEHHEQHKKIPSQHSHHVELTKSRRPKDHKY